MCHLEICDIFLEIHFIFKKIILSYKNKYKELKIILKKF